MFPQVWTSKCFEYFQYFYFSSIIVHLSGHKIEGHINMMYLCQEEVCIIILRKYKALSYIKLITYKINIFTEFTVIIVRIKVFES